MSVDRLMDNVTRLKNPSVMGLDPRPELVPPSIMKKYIAQSGETLEAASEAYLEYCLGLLEAAEGIVPAIKPQLACFEALGPFGMLTLRKVMEVAREGGFYIIADGKRGDIGSTAEDYAKAYLGVTRIGNAKIEPFPADALTVNPYLGSDNAIPFIEKCKDYNKMMFVLVKTSNKSSIEVQELIAGDRPLYRIIAEQCEKAGDLLMGTKGYSSLGIVVGATHPKQLKELRTRFSNMYFLIPGYGVQGGKPDDIAYGFDKYGRGAVVNSSRGLIGAWQKKADMDWKKAVREACEKMRDDLRASLPGGII